MKNIDILNRHGRENAQLVMKITCYNILVGALLVGTLMVVSLITVGLVFTLANPSEVTIQIFRFKHLY